MFKGSPESNYQQRTPSVWLLPNTNQVTIRISTEVNSDTGKEIAFLSFSISLFFVVSSFSPLK
jgi:hypothetical protein